MLIEEYLQMRILSAECILAGEELAGNVPKAMAEKSAIAELRGVEAFLNDASQNSEVANDSASDNKPSQKFPMNCCECPVDLDEDGCTFQYGGDDCWAAVRREHLA